MLNTPKPRGAAVTATAAAVVVEACGAHHAAHRASASAIALSACAKKPSKAPGKNAMNSRFWYSRHTSGVPGGPTYVLAQGQPPLEAVEFSNATPYAQKPPYAGA